MPLRPQEETERTYDFGPLVIDVNFDASKFNPREIPLYPFNLTAQSSGGELKSTLFGNRIWDSPDGPLMSPPSFEYTGRALAAVEELLRVAAISVEDHIKERLKLQHVVLNKKVQEIVQEVEAIHAVSEGVPEETLKSIEEELRQLWHSEVPPEFKGHRLRQDPLPPPREKPRWRK